MRFGSVLGEPFSPFLLLFLVLYIVDVKELKPGFGLLKSGLLLVLVEVIFVLQIFLVVVTLHAEAFTGWFYRLSSFLDVLGSIFHRFKVFLFYSDRFLWVGIWALIVDRCERLHQLIIYLLRCLILRLIWGRAKFVSHTCDFVVYLIKF